MYVYVIDILGGRKKNYMLWNAAILKSYSISFRFLIRAFPSMGL